MRHLVWLSLLAGCGGSLETTRVVALPDRASIQSAPPRAVRASPPADAPRAAAPPPSPLGRPGVIEWGEPSARTGSVEDGSVWLDVRAVPAGVRCTSPGDCDVWVDYVVASGVSVDVWLREVRILSGRGARLVYELAPGTFTLAPGMQRALRVNHRSPGNDAIVLVLTRPDGTTLETEPSVTRIRDLAHDEALAACEACHGVFGAWGISGREGCNCRTRDVGAECRDGLACEGECEPVRAEPVSVDGAVVGRRWVGRCSEFRMRFGCHARIADAAQLEPLLPAGGALHRSLVCVD